MLLKKKKNVYPHIKGIYFCFQCKMNFQEHTSGTLETIVHRCNYGIVIHKENKYNRENKLQLWREHDL